MTHPHWSPSDSTCPVCQADLDSNGKGHTTACTNGRCGITWNPDRWPYMTRCVKIGQTDHGEGHLSDRGETIPGEWMSRDQILGIQ